MGAGLAKNIGTILICRFLSAFFGAPPVAVGAGSAADLWDLQEGGGIAGMLFILMPFLGSSLAPLVGGYTVESRGDWNWTMWALIIVGGPAWIASFFAPETSQKAILKKRALERGMTPAPRLPPKEALKVLLTITLFRPIHMLLFEPMISWISLYVAFVFGILFAFFDAFPYVFLKYYGFTLGQVGLTYLGIVIGYALAAVTFIIVDKTIYAKAKQRVSEKGKIPPPEERLYSCMIGSALMPISLFWFAWTANGDIHWIVPVLAGIPFGWGLVLLFVSSRLNFHSDFHINAILQIGASCYLIDAYQALNAASAVAANSLLRYIFAAAFPLFTVQMLDKLGVAWACSLLGFISVAMLPIPWILFKYGPFLRRRSAYKMGNF
jgi:MFS family permease